MLVGSLWTRAAAAQAQSLDTYSLAPLQRGSLIGVWGSAPLAPFRYELGLGMQVRPGLANEQTASGSPKTGVTTSTLELLATLGLWQGLDISAGITASSGGLNDSSSGAAQSSTALGDVRLIPRLRLVGGDSGAALALAAPIWIPAGKASAVSERGVRIEPLALASYFGKSITLSANAGYLFNRTSDSLGRGWRDAITVGLGAELPVVDTWSVVSELASRWQLHDAPSTRPPLEARAALRFSLASWVVQVGGGMGLQGGAAQPDWRLLAAVGFQAPEGPQTSAKARSDGAPRNDEADPCGIEAGGDPSGEDGCPREPSEPQELAEEQPPVAGEASPEAMPVEITTNGPLPPIREILHFELNKMDLAADQLAVLDRVEAQLRSAPADAQLMIEGHSDNVGPPPFNSSLSRMRASTVRFYLIQRGIPWRRLLISGYGSSRPIELDAGQASRARNRRVEFRLIRKPRAPR